MQNEKSALLVPSWGGHNYSAAPKGTGVGVEAGADYLLGLLPVPYAGIDIGTPHTGLRLGGPLPHIGFRSGLYTRPPGLNSSPSSKNSLWGWLMQQGKSEDEVNAEKDVNTYSRFQNISPDDIAGEMQTFSQWKDHPREHLVEVGKQLHKNLADARKALEAAREKNKNKKEEPEEKEAANSPAWQRSAGKNPEGGLNAKGRASYHRETGGTLKAPVTESNPKGERATRQNSFCSRMCGMKRVNTGAEAKKDPDSRINKSLRKWNCKCGSAKQAEARVADPLVPALLGLAGGGVVGGLNAPKGELLKYILGGAGIGGAAGLSAGIGRSLGAHAANALVSNQNLTGTSAAAAELGLPIAGILGGGLLSLPVARRIEEELAYKPQKLEEEKQAMIPGLVGAFSGAAGGKTKKDPDSRINKSLRKWNCKCGSTTETSEMLQKKAFGIGTTVGTIGGVLGNSAVSNLIGPYEPPEEENKEKTAGALLDTLVWGPVIGGAAGAIAGGKNKRTLGAIHGALRGMGLGAGVNAGVLPAVALGPQTLGRVGGVGAALGGAGAGGVGGYLGGASLADLVTGQKAPWKADKNNKKDDKKENETEHADEDQKTAFEFGRKIAAVTMCKAPEHNDQSGVDVNPVAAGTPEGREKLTKKKAPVKAEDVVGKKANSLVNFVERKPKNEHKIPSGSNLNPVAAGEEHEDVPEETEAHSFGRRMADLHRDQA